MNISPKDMYPGLGASAQQDKDNLIKILSDLEKVKPFISFKIFTAQATSNNTGSKTNNNKNNSSENQTDLIAASGQAILTYVVAGEAAYSDSTGKRGILKKDGWSWIIAGSGICYSIEPLTSDYVGVQVCIALSPALENSAAQSAYLDSVAKMPNDPVQVLIGWHDKSRSKFAIPSQVNCFVVHLKAHQRWRYELPLNHKLAWMGLISGHLQTSAGDVQPQDVNTFNRTDEKIEFHALTDSILVLGSSMEFGYDLMFQQNSVHTSTEGLLLGLKGIAEAKRVFNT